MKKWIKRNGKWLVTGLGILFITNVIVGIIVTKNEMFVIFHFINIALCLIILSIVLGTFQKVYDWWTKD